MRVALQIVIGVSAAIFVVYGAYFGYNRYLVGSYYQQAGETVAVLSAVAWGVSVLGQGSFFNYLAALLAAVSVGYTAPAHSIPAFEYVSSWQAGFAAPS